FRQHARDRAHDPGIAGAAAEIAAELEADARGVGVREPAHDVARGHQHAGRAVAALEPVLGLEGGAKPRGNRILVEPLDGADLAPLAGERQGDAGARRRIVDQQGAGAADAVLAADMRAGQELLLAQEIGEAGARLDHRADRGAVDREAKRLHAAASASARRSATRWTPRSIGSSAPRRSASAASATASPSSSTGLPPVAPMTARRIWRAG